MIIDSDEDLLRRIANGSPLEIIAKTANVPYSRLVRLREEQEALKVVEGCDTDEELVGVIADIGRSEVLDSRMFDLSNTIINKIETIAHRAEGIGEIAGCVEALAVLREAFYGKGTSVVVNHNTQINSGGEGSSGSLSQFTRNLGR